MASTEPTFCMFGIEFMHVVKMFVPHGDLSSICASFLLLRNLHPHPGGRAPSATPSGSGFLRQSTKSSLSQRARKSWSYESLYPSRWLSSPRLQLPCCFGAPPIGYFRSHRLKKHHYFSPIFALSAKLFKTQHLNTNYNQNLTFINYGLFY